MRRQLFFPVFLAFLLLPLAAARAGANPFTIADVKVDATASSASEAARIAIDEGRRKAWNQLIDRLVPAQDRGRVPEVDDDTLKPMTQGYLVSNEERSTTRYVADVTYTFNGQLVRRFLRGASVAYADVAAPPLLIIPMAPSYAPQSDWTKAWAGKNTAGAVPLVMPAGDALDESILSPLDYDAANWTDVQPVASRAHAAQAALVRASQPANGQLTVSIRVLTPSGSQPLGPVNVPVAQGAQPQQVWQDAMNAAAQTIGNAWQARNAIDFGRQSTLTAEVRIQSLEQWGRLRQRLAKVPVVTNVNVTAMNIGQAELAIGYAGTMAQLNDFLSQAALQLSSRDGVFWLSARDGQDGQGAVDSP